MLGAQVGAPERRLVGAASGSETALPSRPLPGGQLSGVHSPSRVWSGQTCSGGGASPGLALSRDLEVRVTLVQDAPVRDSFYLKRSRGCGGLATKGGHAGEGRPDPSPHPPAEAGCPLSPAPPSGKPGPPFDTRPGLPSISAPHLPAHSLPRTQTPSEVGAWTDRLGTPLTLSSCTRPRTVQPGQPSTFQAWLSPSPALLPIGSQWG